MLEDEMLLREQEPRGRPFEEATPCLDQLRWQRRKEWKWSEEGEAGPLTEAASRLGQFRY